MRVRAWLLALGAGLALSSGVYGQARPPSQRTGPITIYGDGSTGPADTFSIKPIVRGATYYLNELLRRQIHALDFCTAEERGDISSYTGALDARQCLQTAIDTARDRGKALWVDAGFWNLKGRVTVSGMGQTIRGEGWGELPNFTPAGVPIRTTKGTIINFDYLALTDPYGIYLTASNPVIRDIELRQTQPNPGPGWTPNVGPWGVYAYADPLADAGAHRMTVDNVMLRNLYDGINTGITRGGTFSDVFGQPFHRGIRVESNVDEPHFRNIHLGWTYWTGQADALAWEHANLVALDFLRVDNPKLTSVFTFNANVGLRCSQRTDSYNPGNCNRLSAANLEFDAVVTGMDLQDGAVVSVANYGCYADSAVAGSTCLNNRQVVATDFFQGSSIEISGADLQGASGPAMQFGFSPLYSPPTHQLSNVRIRSFDQANAGNSAITAAARVTVQKGNLVVDGTTDPSRIFGGAGRLIIPGNGLIDGAGYTEMTNGMILQWGKVVPTGGTATVTFPRACSVPAYSVTAVPEFTATASALEAVSVSNVSATGFLAYNRYSNGSAIFTTNEAIFWQAVCKQ